MTEDVIQLLLIATADENKLQNMALRLRKKGIVVGSSSEGLGEAMKDAAIAALKMRGIIR